MSINYLGPDQFDVLPFRLYRIPVKTFDRRADYDPSNISFRMISGSTSSLLINQTKLSVHIVDVRGSQLVSISFL